MFILLFFFMTVTYPRISRFDGTPAYKFKQPVPVVPDNAILWDDDTPILWDDDSYILWDS